MNELFLPGNALARPMNGKKWIQCLEARPRALVRLFCFAYAGGGAGVFRRWPRFISKHIEVHAIQLPGRENRFREACAQSMNEVLESVQCEMRQMLDLPCAFFGHSLGALSAYEMAAVLEEQEGRPAAHLIVSGRSAPHLHRAGNFHVLPDEFLLSELLRLNGTAPQVLDDPEFQELFLPMLRGDYRILETYYHTRKDPLTCPVTACSGNDDSEVSPTEMLAWQEITSGRFVNRVFPGGHFYINARCQELASLINSTLLHERGTQCKDVYEQLST